MEVPCGGARAVTRFRRPPCDSRSPSRHHGRNIDAAWASNPESERCMVNDNHPDARRNIGFDWLAMLNKRAMMTDVGRNKNC
jgi:hypothetical protein